jgi:hypothetical protein
MNHCYHDGSGIIKASLACSHVECYWDDAERGLPKWDLSNLDFSASGAVASKLYELPTLRHSVIAAQNGPKLR